ncbi:hypothetical protein BGZ94_008054 [Podila epigama]|nr:hypothetical protein BGZ94_008054 [Podila epigama]
MTNPTVIVTGASRGIGRSIVLLAIQKQGANVVGVARSEQALEQLAHHIEHDLKLPNRFKFVVGDLTDSAISTKALDLASRSWSGRIDALVMNAGVLDPILPVSSAVTQDWKKNFDVNFFSVVDMVQKAIPALREAKGRVILVSSGAAVNAYHAWGAYCTSKAALNMFGSVLGVEEPEITTVSVRPGVVDTEMQSVIRTEGAKGMVPEQHKQFVNFHTTGALLHPDQPGGVIASLAVKADKALSGQFYSWNSEELKAYQN